MSTTRTHFERALNTLNEDVLRLGALARQAVGRAMQALLEGDEALAQDVIAQDAEINALRFAIEKHCYTLIATESPVAGDLRLVVAALIVAIDLERIGDHGKKIARTYLRMREDPRPVPPDYVAQLSQVALALLDRALRAYGARDSVEAVAVCQADDQVDALYKQTFNILLEYMLEDPRLIGAAAHLLQVAHELERVGDRATNVAERVIYSVTGELTELNL